MENKTIFQEAFRQLEDLDEEVFDLRDENSFDKIEDFVNADDNEVDTTLDIIDADAETEEDLEDSYVNKVILDCCVCHSKIYKDPEEITLDDEKEYANIDEECPYCYSTDGYKIVGQVAPFSEDDAEESEEESKEDIEVEVDDEPVEVSDDDIDDATDSKDESLRKRNIDRAKKIIESRNRRRKLKESTPYNESLDNGRVDSEKTVIYKSLGKFCATPESNFNINHQDARKIHKLDDFDSAREIMDYYNKYFHTTDDDFIVMDESFEKVDIETEDETMTMTQDPETHKVTVETQSKEASIVPVDDSTKEIIDAKNAEKESEEDSIIDDNDVDIDVDEFSEEDFDDLGESYLKKVYENVNSFKTTLVTQDMKTPNKIVIEGLITFASGKSKKTQFVFEAKDITKKGKARFLGENTQISRGKKSFVLTGSINSGKFIAESLNYNYSQNGNRLYGTVRRKNK